MTITLRVTAEEEARLSSLPQFHGLETGTLLRLVKQRTGITVTSRWTAISLILTNRIPIPVVNDRDRFHPSMVSPSKLQIVWRRSA